MQWPGRIRPGNVYDLPVISLDIVATIMANMDRKLPVKNKLDGVNLLPLVNDTSPTTPTRLFFWRNFDRERLAVRSDEFKLVLQKGQAPSLFRITDDIGERNNLLPGSAKISGKLHAAWKKWESELKDPVFLGLLKDKAYSKLHKDRFVKSRPPVE